MRRRTKKQQIGLRGNGDTLRGKPRRSSESAAALTVVPHDSALSSDFGFTWLAIAGRENVRYSAFFASESVHPCIDGEWDEPTAMTDRHVELALPWLRLGATRHGHSRVILNHPSITMGRLNTMAVISLWIAWSR